MLFIQLITLLHIALKIRHALFNYKLSTCNHTMYFDLFYIFIFIFLFLLSVWNLWKLWQVPYKFERILTTMKTKRGENLNHVRLLYTATICILHMFNLFTTCCRIKIIFHRASAKTNPPALSFRTLAYLIELGVLLSREHLANCTFMTHMLGSRANRGGEGCFTLLRWLKQLDRNWLRAFVRRRPGSGKARYRA